ncbi:2-dehydropantoate 2-reductase [Thalassolituus hydrocarboniclasticus]|uniref:2-dehydropantoate 2-reductase n=1 Tax=Thalassolituus hydrocarboniclasticus TaxID=2742796 RepID=A0ABY6AC75_9GAMM|nr:2-dehydropantoate 2-reductase [Thalassolituus hydrocarboniclasticus]UXD88636.1 2-dehydropantoate 2-reductase [Thalassolituus hydrocarboniclasticus]
MHIVVYGAGSIGCYLGAALHLEGLSVTLLGRPRIQEEIKQAGGIHISDYIGGDQLVSGISFEHKEAALAQADIVLVTLKCLAMEQAAAALAHYCRPGTRVICLQNGLGSDRVVREECPQLLVSQGIVGFNVLHQDNGHFHRGTDGAVHLSDDDAFMPIRDAFLEQQIPCLLERDFQSVAWGKLQLNLNNAINALADIPLKQELEQRGYRRVLSCAMKELATVAAKKGISLARMTALPPALLPGLINSPDFLFHRLAKKMLEIDPQARSSMWEDLQQKRLTEIHFLNGAVAAEGEKLGVPTPVNRTLCRLIHEVESGKRQQGLSPRELELEIRRGG